MANRSRMAAGQVCADQGLVSAASDLIVGKLFMAAITIGFVGALLTLAKVVILAFVAFERHRGEFSTLM